MGTIVIDEHYEKCRKLLKENISPKRYAHSIGVSNTAACLAMRYGCDVNKAYLAGLLHDCAKGLKPEELVSLVESEGMEISEAERDNPELLHAKAGSILARDKYKTDDEEILGSICWHTTGRPGMTLLEEIIFTADYIEPNRTNIPNLYAIRRSAFVDMDRTIALICRNTLDYLKSGRSVIDKMTMETYEYYSNRVNRSKE